MNVASFDFMRPVDENIFRPVTYVILLRISAFMYSYSISAYFTFSDSSFLYLHLFNVLTYLDVILEDF